MSKKPLKSHWMADKYKDNYESIKYSLEKFSSELCKFLAYENKHVSEKGLKNLINHFGQLRKVIYSQSKNNRDLYFRASSNIDKMFQTIKSLSKK